MHNAEGEQVWERSLDTFGKVITGDNSSCPFMYQGQYYDAEVELAYNRFRYYDPEDGRYISQDPIGLNSGEFNLYSYVDDTNGWIDALGLAGTTTFTSSDGLTLDVKNVQDLSRVNGKGMTNAELDYMAKNGTSGRIPKHGKLDLHHQKQNPQGPIIEIPAKYHSIGNKKQHPNGSKKGGGLSDTDRILFNKWRTEYWKMRAQKEIETRKKKGTYTK